MTDRFLTIVVRNPTADEARELVYHPKLSATSWSHAMDERDNYRHRLQTMPDAIKLPPDKIHNWLQLEKIGYSMEDIVKIAYCAGADMELEASCEWLTFREDGIRFAAELRASRRPKPPSRKSQAFDALDRLTSYNGDVEARATLLDILETLPDD